MAGSALGHRIYPCLVAQNAYLRDCRTVPGSELAFVVDPWETGMGNCRVGLAAGRGAGRSGRLRHPYPPDLDHAADDERPTDEDYARYIRLACAYRDHGYDDRWAGRGRVRGGGPRVQRPVGLVGGGPGRAGRPDRRRPGPHRAAADRITAGLVDDLYLAGSDLGSGLFHATDRRAGRRLTERTVAGLLPLLLPGLPTSVADQTLATLTGPAFRAGGPDVIGVPSFDLTDPRFDPQRYWRGPAWPNTGWLIGHGLRTQGRPELAADVLADVVTLAEALGVPGVLQPPRRKRSRHRPLQLVGRPGPGHPGRSGPTRTSGNRGQTSTFGAVHRSLTRSFPGGWGRSAG